MAERSNAAVLKTVDPKGPGVRIPLSPQTLKPRKGHFNLDKAGTEIAGVLLLKRCMYPGKQYLNFGFILFLNLMISCNTSRRNSSIPGSSTINTDSIPYYKLEAEQDLDILISEIGDASVVLLGESTHGTHEFYTWRTALTKKLILEKGFDFMAIEGDWTDAFKINKLMRERTHDSSEIIEALKLFDRWPQSMWGNYEIAGLLQWINNYNLSGKETKIGFYGLDIYSFWEWTQQHPNTKDDNLLNLINKTRDFFAVYNNDALKYGASSSQIKNKGHDLVNQLFNKTMQHSNSKQPADERGFVLYQQGWLTMNGEKYFRTMRDDRVKAINLRDQHMAESIKRLLKFHGPGAKAVVWLHNGHAGDIRYSSPGTAGYTSVAEILKKDLGGEKVFSVGFGTYKGKVLAGYTWNAPVLEQIVLPAKEGSWESLLHRQNNANKLMLSRELKNNPRLNKWIEFRSIGAVYSGAALYTTSIIPERFDAFVFIDSTTALRPIASRVN
jgi:erythromycin esterase